MQISLVGQKYHGQTWSCGWDVVPTKQELWLACSEIGDPTNLMSTFSWGLKGGVPSQCPATSDMGCVTFALQCQLPNGCCDAHY